MTGPPAVTGPPADGGLHVVATAGHVDHGKSALILRLTGIDPDRLAEEKRRGLTIDLGFAWATLPSGREVGFVDVPGHERFIRNMLAGVGPVRLVLFVVAADEGWKPQSEEHLQILDVLGASGAVVALTKRDLVAEDDLRARAGEVRDRLAGTHLQGAPVIPCSAVTGDGVEDLRAALDAMIAGAPQPERTGRPRHFLDRVFTIRGAGTVVTGTLTGGPLAVGQESEVLPAGHRARIRGLQTHKRSLQQAAPVSRVAVNLAGTPTAELGRGDVLTLPGQWRPTARFDAWVRPVRALDHRLGPRGAYKLYAGSAERDARLRFLAPSALEPEGEAFVRVSLSRPVVLDLGDAFVIREAGRQETVAGGVVLDAHPASSPGPDPAARLRARLGAGQDRSRLAWLEVLDRRAVRAADLPVLTGVGPQEAIRQGALPVGQWLVAPDAFQEAARVVEDALAEFHATHPLRPGIELGDVRSILLQRSHLADPGLADAVLARMAEQGRVTRQGTTLRLPGHAVTTAGREDADRLVRTVAAAEPSPPTVKELVGQGFGPELIRAACAEGRLVRVAPDIVVTPELLARAEAIVRERGRPPGVTVSAFREALGTSRKYALPMLEHFDSTGLTRRQGDVRLLRG